ncbi:MAG: hypothetical protein IJK81_10410 [Selenomonadaceae bacterium]|nr:hypothetical protein [Selenomonadaceae bacterium]
MLKKILIGVVVLGAIAFAVIGFGTYKVADETLKEHEPQLRQYLQMDEAAQDKYILDNVNELLSNVDLDKDGKPEDREKLQRLMKLNEQPEIQKAFIDVGRSALAGLILFSDPIVKDMSADIKDKYEKESKEFEARADKYTKLIEAADPTLKDK